MGKKGGNKSPGENTRTPGSEGKCLMVSCEEGGNLGLLAILNSMFDWEKLEISLPTA